MTSPRSISNGVPIVLALSSLLGAAGFVYAGRTLQPDVERPSAPEPAAAPA